MRYSQFLELTELLEKNQLSLEDLKKNPDIIPINEEEEPKELDTKRGNILTRRGRQRMALNKHAKRLQGQINKDVADKFLPEMSNLKAELYKKMAEMGKEKQPKEIVSALRSDLKNVQNIQNKQINLIEKHAQKAIDQMTEKIDSTIEKKNLKDTTKANLKTYWSLLTTQIMMNLLQRIAKKSEEIIGKTIQDPDILKAAKAIEKTLNKSIAAKTEERKQKAEERKRQIEEEDKKAAEAGTEEKSEEEKTEKE